MNKAKLLYDVSNKKKKIKENFIRKNGYCEEFKYNVFDKFDLSNTILHYTDFTGSYIRHSKLNNSDFWNGNLENVDITDTDMRNVILDKTNLKDSKLSFVDLSGSTISNVNLRNSVISYSNLSRAKINNVWLGDTEFIFCNFKDVIIGENVFGFMSNKEWLDKCCYKMKDGYLVIVEITTNSKNLSYKNGYITSRLCKDRKDLFGDGITIYPTKMNCESLLKNKQIYIEAIINYNNINNVVVPYGNQAYARCNRVKPLNILKGNW